ncbi:hypothetical protein CDD80_2199 [Ophiocordyceps camponoti-rufipedis]|uniref:ABC transmembrane type-1 domain-containing protein n=1 Tax=Ophiocordyceps camponoti-rufipedis TaxID=2004952 RepID=A0A2C5XV81_9HYPO|nr:hypothetical protein CDD80_2199 [Ophiocordyceps camponoti-rufipedis]
METSKPTPEPKDQPRSEPQPRPQQTASFKDYRRVFSYASKWDLVAYAAGGLASVGAGVTLPLMNVVFGKLVGNASDFAPQTEADREHFRQRLSQLSLYMFALFIARFGLDYINKVDPSLSSATSTQQLIIASSVSA